MTDVLNGMPRVYVLTLDGHILPSSSDVLFGVGKGTPIYGYREAAKTDAARQAYLRQKPIGVLAIPVEVVGVFAPDGTVTTP